MKTLARGFVLSLGVLMAAGCASPQSARIQKSPELFGSLTPGQQKLIQAGEVKVGFTADMVYLALGKPSKVITFKAPDDQVDAWIYRQVSTRVRRQAFASSYERTGMGAEWYGPQQEVSVEGDPYTLELTFHAGVVVAIKIVG